ncbi:MAG TPA: metal-dependent hydrolase [Vicinamibacterales bacterium]|nr:metal-dependent hydrolase [Vicinamibacterales bacterium]
MDNITHSLVGVALADLAMGRRASKAQRPLLVGAGIVGANLPDIDIAFSWITPAPLGYLLHHRGHTHTVAGLAVLAVAMYAVYWYVPAVRKMPLPARLRVWLLIVIALVSHLALDSLNSYGVHPFYPFDNTWYFGDAVFILEPWLWIILGVAVAWNGRTRTARLVAMVPMALILATAAATGVVSLAAVAALLILGAAFAVIALRLSPYVRTAAALTVCAAIVGGFLATSRIARGAAVDALGAQLRGDVLDIVLTPNASSLLCWEMIAIELREADGEYVLWRGTLSLMPAMKVPTACASHQLFIPGPLPPGGMGPRAARIIGNGRLALRDEIHQPLQRLRTLAERDCWVRAWLRFGRAPVIEEDSILDLRFSDRPGREFTIMRVRHEGCPPHVPNWGMPRADLLR